MARKRRREEEEEEEEKERDATLKFVVHELKDELYIELAEAFHK
jgi:hypothetical protein